MSGWRDSTVVAGFAIETTPQSRDARHVTTIVQLDSSDRIVLSRELRRAAGVPRGQKLKASATPGRIVLKMVSNHLIHEYEEILKAHATELVLSLEDVDEILARVPANPPVPGDER